MTWRAIRLLEDGPRPGAWNMALDEALMDTARQGFTTLRLYGFDPPCLSLGRNQRARGCYNEEVAAARGVEIVRRPTGGRAVYHHRELTYSVTAPDSEWGGLRDSYGRINQALARGLAELGVPVSLWRSSGGRPPGLRAPRPTPDPCFRDPLPGEISLAGRKLVGSAQWRRDGALLQHGSLLLHDDQRVVEELQREEAPSAAKDAMSIGLDEVCRPLPSPADLIRAVRRGFEAEFGLEVERVDPTPQEREMAQRLEIRYRAEGWTWRR